MKHDHTEQDSLAEMSRLGREISDGLYGLLTDQMDGLIELHFESDATKVEVGHWYGLLLLRMSLLDIFGLNLDLKSTPKPAARF